MKCRLIIDINRCKGCELCIGVCSRHILSMASGLNPSGVHFPQISSDHECSGCRYCAILCPEAAIEIEKLAAIREPKQSAAPQKKAT